jgi:succinate-semialdehyde dehydrogenase/glutarate-semialdehyde dehydrogenase
MIQSINPATNEVLRTFTALTSEQLEQRLSLAADAAISYPQLRLDQRVFWMRRLALLLEAESEELAAIMTAEMGKTLAAARAEIAKCANGCRYYADHAATILAPEHIKTTYEESYVRYDPLGVILAIMPWNFPLWQVFRFAAPALMGGNVVLLKHATNTPQCSLAIETLVRRAGFPRGSFQALLLETEQVEHVIADPRVAAVTLTGSEAAGRAVAAQAGWFLKKVVLELGGSDPFIVMRSADIISAVDNAVAARCVNNGQSCIAAKRFLIHDSVYDSFTRRFVEAMSKQRVGDPALSDTQLGPLATPKILDSLLAQIDAAVAAGGELLTGGKRIDRQGNYLQPTVIANVPPTSDIAKQETFGPLALLFRIHSIEEAIALANATPFGLGASVWTNDLTEQQRFSTSIAAGMVFFNTQVASDPRLPFGGIKNSGYGRELSSIGMREFLNAKTVAVAERPGTHKPQRTLFEVEQND